MARGADLADAYERLELCGADAELIELCKKCLAPRKEDRPRTAREVAEAVVQYQAEVQERLQTAEKERAAAQARAEEEQRTRQAEELARQEAEARERAERGKRKRTFALALIVIVVLLGGLAGAAWLLVQREQARRSAETLASEADGFLVRGLPAEARTKARTAKVTISNHWGFDELHQRLDQQLARADARLRLNEFLTRTSEAEYHLLGTSLLFAPTQEPESGRGFVRMYERGTSLQTGIDIGEQALALYRLPDELEPILEFHDLELTEDEAKKIRDRAANLLALVAVGLHQQGKEALPAERQGQWRRAGRHFNAAESLGLRSRFLYQQRAALRQSLGEKTASQEDGQKAKTAAADLFLDIRFQAAEAGRAGDWTKAVAAWRTQGGPCGGKHICGSETFAPPKATSQNLWIWLRTIQKHW